MSKLRRFLFRMLLFLLLVILIIFIIFDSLYFSFLTNPAINGLIVLILTIGIIHSFRQVITLRAEIRWLELVKANRLRRSSDSPKLLSSISRILGDNPNITGLSALASRSMLDGVTLRLEEARDISRYLIGLLVFLGLLGTFWGLLGTISSVGEMIGKINIIDDDIVSSFSSLKAGLEKPLEGMGTAFSSSLFGLAGSLILGFLDLQASQAQNQFSNDLEEWFASLTTVSTGNFDNVNTQSMPVYLQALLQQTAEATNKLHRTLERGDLERKNLSNAMVDLAEKMSEISDKVNSSLNNKDSTNTNSLTHIRSIDNSLKQLINESSLEREQFINELRTEIKILAKTISLVQNKNTNGN